MYDMLMMLTINPQLLIKQTDFLYYDVEERPQINFDIRRIWVNLRDTVSPFNR